MSAMAAELFAGPAFRAFEIGRRVNTMRVMVKPLADEGVPAYLARVPRDRPGSPQGAPPAKGI